MASDHNMILFTKILSAEITCFISFGNKTAIDSLFFGTVNWFIGETLFTSH